MIKNLTVINFSQGLDLAPSDGTVFTLSTCQRTLIAGLNEDIQNYCIKNGLTNIHDQPQFEIYDGEKSYQFLLETICGLQSKVVAEYEVVGQFRSAYKEFMSISSRNTFVQHVIEKLLKDSKEIRTKHLQKIGQLTYSGITRKMLLKNTKDFSKAILITGSGTLAEKLVKNLKKKFTIVISARNKSRVNELCQLYGVTSIPWGETIEYSNYHSIVNTIGINSIIFNQDFFELWKLTHDDGIFIDLGSPSCIKTHYTRAQNIFRLTDIFENGKELGQEKESQVKLAQLGIRQLTINRVNSLKAFAKQNHGDFQFA